MNPPSSTKPPIEPAGDAQKANYEVLARKYRPRNFEDLIGHEAMVRTLENAFTANRIAHAYILTGVRGVGKTTTARILARALNYEPAPQSGENDSKKTSSKDTNSQDNDNQDSGPQIHMKEDGIHCQAIADSRHPDVMEMDAASRTGVGDIRELIEGVRYAPIEARYKVYIIDEVHMLSTAAFNALLKTLEEPPPHVKFIFATTEIRKLPVTVLSRCQRFDLRRIDPETMVTHLRAIAEAEGIHVDDDGLTIIARAAEGSVRDALSILDQAIVQHTNDTPDEATNSVRAETIQAMLGLADRGQTWGLVEACLKGDAPDALTAFRDQYDAGADPTIIIKDMLEITHLLTRVKAAGDTAAHHGPAGAADSDKATKLAGQLAMNSLTRAWTLLMKGLDETRIAPDPLAAGEMALIRLCYAADLPTPDEALRLLKSGAISTGNNSVGSPSQQQGGASSAAANPPPPQAEDRSTIIPLERPSSSHKPHRPAPAAGPTLTSLKDIAALAGKKRDARLRTEIESFVRIVSFEPLRITLRLEEQAPDDLPNRLMRALKDWTGEHWSIAVAPHEDGDVTLRDRRQSEVMNHPMVKKALDLFPGASVERIREPVDTQTLNAADDGSDGEVPQSTSSIDENNDETTPRSGAQKV